MSTLSQQEKLALIMSAAGSQRNLAAWLGITHQKVGRWLREGETGGITRIPNDAATKEAINNLFSIYTGVVKEQSKRDNLPFNKDVPLYAERMPLKTGLPGDRVISGNTEYIRQPLRMRWVAGVVESKKFYKVNVRSRVNLKRYFDRAAAEELESGRRRSISQRKLSNSMLDSWIKREAEESKNGLPGRIVEKTEPFSFFTQDQATFNVATRQVIRGVENQLAQKHSPATGEPGTRFAYEYLLQAFPANHVHVKSRYGKPVSAGGKATPTKTGAKKRK